MRLLVAIVNYRTPELTIDCLRSLEPEVRTLGDVRVVVADNASGDGSQELVRAAIVEHGWSRWASLLSLGRNGGFSVGNNAIIGPALEAEDKPEYVLLLNSDTVACGGALVALLDFMDAHPLVGIAGSRVEEPDGTHQDSCYRFHSVWSELDAGLRVGVVSRLLHRHAIAPPPQERAHPIDWVVGASMMVRRKVFEDIGLLDPGYFLYFEESDFCLSARRAGWSCWYVPASRVVHLCGQSSGITNPLGRAVRRPRYWFESRHRYFVKNHGRAYALCADLAWSAGFALWVVRRSLLRKPHNDPPHMLWDFLRFRIRPGRVEFGRVRGGAARILRRLSVLVVLAFGLLEVSARVLTGTYGNGMPAFGRFPLLPYRPTRETIEQELERSSHSTYIVSDPELGWTIRPDGVGMAGAKELYHSNGQGLRARRERVYAPRPPQGKVRIVTIGDSFTHCDEVANGETWQDDLEARRDDLELLNLGVPGFGTDQALLRWRRDGRRFAAQFVLLGIWPENVCRNIGLLRYYLVPGGSFASKPMMVVAEGDQDSAPALRIINSPVLSGTALIDTLIHPESQPLLANDYWYREQETRPLWYRHLRTLQVAESLFTMRARKREREHLYSGADPAGIDITVAIARQFALEVLAEGSTPLVLMIPMREQLGPQGEAPIPLVLALRRQGLEVLDLGPPMARAYRARGERLYTPEGHHSREGNLVFAELLEKELDRRIQTARQ